MDAPARPTAKAVFRELALYAQAVAIPACWAWMAYNDIGAAISNVTLLLLTLWSTLLISLQIHRTTFALTHVLAFEISKSALVTAIWVGCVIFKVVKGLVDEKAKGQGLHFEWEVYWLVFLGHTFYLTLALAWRESKNAGRVSLV
ncbi:hypothetical protein G7Y89_g1115 [Cudoniella acicularis]|uniref:Uncharacterized protein n=1 Tax=Cudoniella acicularis TaxID=354080 RepID=A0A8H4W7Q4_9HELO|nr:hypothetical protein G7Y89_g1115 [Cudoniella acicularis]